MEKSFPLSEKSNLFKVVGALDFLWEEGWNGLNWVVVQSGTGFTITSPGIYLVDTSQGKKTIFLGEAWSSASGVAIVDASGDSPVNPIIIKTVSGTTNEGRNWAISVSRAFMRFVCPDGESWRTVDTPHQARSQGILDAIMPMEHRALRSIELTNKNALSLTDTEEPGVGISVPQERRIVYL